MPGVSERSEGATKVTSQPWELLQTPWSRLHIDHAGPVGDKTLLIIMCTHRKWIDTPLPWSTATIEKVRSTFPTHSLPQKSVYGPAFTFRVLVQLSTSISNTPSFIQWHECNGLQFVNSCEYLVWSWPPLILSSLLLHNKWHHIQWFGVYLCFVLCCVVDLEPFLLVAYSRKNALPG